MYVSATVRYEASSLSPLSRRAGRRNGERRDQADADAPATPEEIGPEAVLDLAPDESAFDAADEVLGYTPALADAASEPPPTDPAPSAPAVPTAPPPEGSLFDLLDRAASKP